MKIEMSKLKEYLSVFLAYLAIAIAMFWQLVANFSTSVWGYGGDVYQSMWNLWWVRYSIFTLHASPYFTNFIFYPLGANLVTQTMAPLLGIFTYPLQMISLPLALNTAIFAGIVLSGLFMYILAKYLTGSKYGSFIAGLIFAFSPEHTIQSVGHMQWTNIEFIPLFLLFFLLMLKERKLKYAIYSSISFVLAVFAGDVEQGILIALLVFFILLYYLIFDKHERRNILSKRFAYLFGVLAVLAFLLGSPGFIPMINGIRGGVLSYVNTQGDIVHNILYSYTLSSFFLPPFNNLIFGSINGYASFYARSVVDTAESVGYIGYSVLFLAIFGIFASMKKKELERIGVWIFIAIIFGWLSLGPYIRISGMPTSTSGLMPGLYIIYHNIPLFNVFREPGRFDFATTLALALLAAFGFKHLSEGSKSKSTQLLFALFAILILLEYWAYYMPPVTPAVVPKAYYYIRQIPGNYSLLILPVFPNYSSQAPNKYLGLELYYQTVFQKPLVGGYATRENSTQLNLLAQIPLAVESNYLTNQGKLLFSYPIIENYTQLNLFMLANFDVGFVGVIREAYNYTNLLQLASYLYTVFGPPIYQSNTTIIFSTRDAIINNVGKNVVAYTVGDWFPGYYACTSLFCNETFSNMWWGSNARGIGVYVPRNSTHLLMNFSAMYYKGNSNLGIYLNSANNPVTIVKLTPYPKNYSVDLNLQPGLNLLVLVTPNATNTAASAFNFGIMNITFSRASP
ncbi:MAG: hypothetical protein ACP5P2_02195 [Candidatus Micrarchaeia archaeon]|jgi:hypothetical protein